MKKKLTRIGQISLPTKLGVFKMLVFQNSQTGKFSIALTVGEVSGQEDVLVRIHSSCVTGDIFVSLLCDCGSQLEQAMGMISDKSRGILIYLDQEGRGIGLANKIKAMELQQKGLDTVDANLSLGLPVDARSYEEAAEILQTLCIDSIRLITNNPNKVAELLRLGIRVSSRISCIPAVPIVTKPYLKTKKERMGHLIPI